MDNSELGSKDNGTSELLKCGYTQGECDGMTETRRKT